MQGFLKDDILALFGRHNPKFFQNNIRESHPKAFISPQIKLIL
jgi:hypothetical protein